LQIRLDIKLADLRKPEIELKFESASQFTQIMKHV